MVAKDTQNLSGNGWTAVLDGSGRLEVSIAAKRSKLIGALKRHLKHVRYDFKIEPKIRIEPKSEVPGIIYIVLRDDDQWDEACRKIMCGAERKLQQFEARKAKRRNTVERRKTKQRLGADVRRLRGGTRFVA